MNPAVIVHFVAAVVAIAAAIPLIKGQVKMNEWYGVRIPAAFESEAAWFDINRFGGRLLFRWGLAVAVTAIVGAFLERKAWIPYNWIALVITVGGLVLVVTKIYQYARKREEANRAPAPTAPSGRG